MYKNTFNCWKSPKPSEASNDEEFLDETCYILRDTENINKLALKNLKDEKKLKVLKEMINSFEDQMQSMKKVHFVKLNEKNETNSIEIKTSEKSSQSSAYSYQNQPDLVSFWRRERNKINSHLYRRSMMESNKKKAIFYKMKNMTQNNSFDLRKSSFLNEFLVEIDSKLQKSLVGLEEIPEKEINLSQKHFLHRPSHLIPLFETESDLPASDQLYHSLKKALKTVNKESAYKIAGESKSKDATHFKKILEEIYEGELNEFNIEDKLQELDMMKERKLI